MGFLGLGGLDGGDLEGGIGVGGHGWERRRAFALPEGICRGKLHGER
jgi:hypothetical protein